MFSFRVDRSRPMSLLPAASMTSIRRLVWPRLLIVFWELGGVVGGVSGREGVVEVVPARFAEGRERRVLEDTDFRVEVKQSSSSPISDSAFSVLIHEAVRRNGVFLTSECVSGLTMYGLRLW